jgi:hypothetical protein
MKEKQKQEIRQEIRQRQVDLPSQHSINEQRLQQPSMPQSSLLQKHMQDQQRQQWLTLKQQQRAQHPSEIQMASDNKTLHPIAVSGTIVPICPAPAPQIISPIKYALNRAGRGGGSGSGGGRTNPSFRETTPTVRSLHILDQHAQPRLLPPAMLLASKVSPPRAPFPPSSVEIVHKIAML